MQLKHILCAGVFGIALTAGSPVLRAQTGMQRQAALTMQREFEAELKLLLGHSLRCDSCRPGTRNEFVVRTEPTNIQGLEAWVGWPDIGPWHGYRVAAYGGRIYRAGGFQQNDLLSLGSALPPVHGVVALHGRAIQLTALANEALVPDRPLASLDTMAVDSSMRGLLSSEVWPDSVYQEGETYRAYVSSLAAGGRIAINQSYFIFSLAGRVLSWRIRTVSLDGR